jgi:hypothetical protein
MKLHKETERMLRDVRSLENLHSDTNGCPPPLRKREEPTDLDPEEMDEDEEFSGGAE